MKYESLSNHAVEEARWEEARYAIPYTDDQGAMLEEWTRDVGVGCTLEGFRVTQISESGNGVEAYPFFVIEPTIEQRDWEYYLRLLEKQEQSGSDLLTDPEKEFMTAMQERVNAERDRTEGQLNTLLEEYYRDRDESSIEGVERLAVARNGDGAIVLAPLGAYIGKEARKEKYPHHSDEEQAKEHEIAQQLYARELALFGEFLKQRFVGNGK